MELFAMSPDRDQLLKTRDAMLAILDAKLKDVPEWTAYRAVEYLLQSMNRSSVPDGTRSPNRRYRHAPRREPYADLALKAIDALGRPMSISELITFIAQHRPIPSDSFKAKLSVGSGLTRDERLVSVSWQGRRAWWYVGRALPEPPLTVEQPTA
jgi:hypothetical protein